MVTQNPTPPRRLDPVPADRSRGAAERALAEAVARRATADRVAALPEEIGGRGGLEPVRFGDWEVNGLASDF